MSDDLVKFKIPGRFVTRLTLLTPAELVYGYRHGWLGRRDVVEVAMADWEAGQTLPSTKEDLALLLTDEIDRVPDLIDELSQQSAFEEGDPASVWLFLALAWLHENRAEFRDPSRVIEGLYADFGYPEEIEGLVGFMPARSGSAIGQRAVEQRWDDYVSRQTVRYRARRPRP